MVSIFSVVRQQGQGYGEYLLAALQSVTPLDIHSDGTLFCL